MLLELVNNCENKSENRDKIKMAFSLKILNSHSRSMQATGKADISKIRMDNR